MEKFGKELNFGTLQSLHFLLIVAVTFLCFPTCVSAHFKCSKGSELKCWTCSAQNSYKTCADNGEWKSCQKNETCSITVKETNLAYHSKSICMGCHDDTQGGRDPILLTDGLNKKCSSLNVNGLCCGSQAKRSRFANYFTKITVMAQAIKIVQKCSQLFNECRMKTEAYEKEEETVGITQSYADNTGPTDPETSTPSLPDTTTQFQCPEVMCMMFCQYGFKKDENGCDICQCIINPCESVTCEADFHCEVQSVAPSTDHPDGYMVVCVPDDQSCREVLCDMLCEYGFTKDKYGCDMCQCVNPCESILCDDSKHCEMRTSNNPDTYAPAWKAICVSNDVKLVTHPGLKTYQSSTYTHTNVPLSSDRAIDKINDNSIYSVSHTLREQTPWWTVDLQKPHEIVRLRITLRRLLEFRFSDFIVGVTNKDPQLFKPELGSYDVCHKSSGAPAAGQPVEVTCSRSISVGRFVVIQLPTNEILEMANVEIYALEVCESPVVCKMLCPYGFEKDEADTGCEICKCFQPCENTCQTNFHCEVQTVNASADHPYRYLGVCVADDEKCPPVLCKMFCQYGFKKNELGCEQCSCYDPCQVAPYSDASYCGEFGDGFICEVQKCDSTEEYPYKYKATCAPKEDGPI